MSEILKQMLSNTSARSKAGAEAAALKVSVGGSW